MPSTGPSSGRSRASARTAPPWASVRCTARSSAVVARLHRASRRAGTRRSASGARPHDGHSYACAVDALLEQQQLDAAVGRRLERLLPARRGTAAPAGLLLPALERAPSPRRAAPARGTAARARAARSASRSPRLRSTPTNAFCVSCASMSANVGARLLRPDDDDRAARGRGARGRSRSSATVAEVLARELVDVPLVARLRPAALVVASRLLLRRGRRAARAGRPRSWKSSAALAVDRRRRSRPRHGRRSGTSGGR